MNPAPPAAESGEPRAASGPALRVLVLCTHNSARSQMAEGLFRELGGGQVEVRSAGSEPSRVSPLAIRAMDALGIDIRGQTSKHQDEFLGQSFDYVITVCDNAREVCPIFPGHPEQIHWSFEDPSAVQGDEETRFRAFLQIAQQLKTRINNLLLAPRSGQEAG